MSTSCRGHDHAIPAGRRARLPSRECPEAGSLLHRGLSTAGVPLGGVHGTDTRAVPQPGAWPPADHGRPAGLACGSPSCEPFTSHVWFPFLDVDRVSSEPSWSHLTSPTPALQLRGCVNAVPATTRTHGTAISHQSRQTDLESKTRRATRLRRSCGAAAVVFLSPR